MGWAKPIYHNVEGAPFRIGQKVEVVGSADDTFNSDYLGHVGTVRYYEYSCGSGQTYPTDPMIGVQFPGGDIEEFWQGELRRFEGARLTSMLATGEEAAS